MYILKSYKGRTMEHKLQFNNKKIVIAIVLALSSIATSANAQNLATPAIASTNNNNKKLPQAPVKPEEAVISYQGNTFDKIRTTGKVLIGFRGAAIPLSYYDENKKPIGYAMDICSNIADKLKQRLNMPSLIVEYVETTPATRIPLVVSGKVDYECGATSSSAERRKQVSFSVPYYMDAVRMLVKNGSPISNLEDLRGQSVAFSKGTVAIPIMKKFNTQRTLNIKFNEVESYAKGVEEIDKGRSVALVTNALLLEGVKLSLPNPNNYSVVGDLLSVEPTSIMLRKNDPEFQSFIDKEMIRIAKTGQLEVYYKKWFLSPIAPKNQVLNIQPSPLLIDIFRMPTSVVGN